MSTISMRYDDVNVGDVLPELPIPLSRSVIVATAIASRDYQDVHHDPGLAQERGSPDIFMNILSTNGFVGRYITDWAGPDAVLKSVKIRLGAPNYPGDTMTMTGAVVEQGRRHGRGRGARRQRPRRPCHRHGRPGAPVSERNRLKDAAAIVGIGATEFSKDSGRSELRLAVEACEAAIADAGLEPADVDGMVTYTADTNPEIEIARNLGIGELSFFSRIHHGGGAACGNDPAGRAGGPRGRGRRRRLLPRVQRALGEPVRRRRAGSRVRSPTAEAAHFSWYAPFGLLTPAQWVAMFATRYMHEYGATSEDFGRIAVADRKHAATNPKAWFYEKPITLEEHQASRWIVEPLHLLDCCQESDGAQAIVVTSLERARDLPNPPVVINAAAQGDGRGPGHDDELLPRHRSPASLRWGWWRASSGTPPGSGPTTSRPRSSTTTSRRSRSRSSRSSGSAAGARRRTSSPTAGIELGGDLPINTHGGQLGEAYIHGMNGIAEGVRQVRGTSVNQVADVEHVLVTAGTGVPTSALVLGVDR